MHRGTELADRSILTGGHIQVQIYTATPHMRKYSEERIPNEACRNRNEKI